MANENEGQGSDRLSQMIANTAYASVPVASDPVHPQAALALDQTGNAEVASGTPTPQPAGGVSEIPAPSAAPAATPAPDPLAQMLAQLGSTGGPQGADPESARVREERDAALRMLSLAAAQARVAEEQKIANDPDLSDAEKRAATAELRLQRAQYQQQQIAQREQERAFRDNDMSERMAKRQIANGIVMRAGIPVEHTELLMQAGTIEQMIGTAQSLMKAYAPQQSENPLIQRRQDLVNNGTFAVGGAGASPTAPEVPKQRTGRLQDYIKSIGYTAVPVG